MFEKEAYNRLVRNGVKPSVQRMAIMQYLLDHRTHPTVEDVYKDLYQKIPTLSRTTVYNTLRLLSENNAAQMITIDEHRVCYDGETKPARSVSLSWIWNLRIWLNSRRKLADIGSTAFRCIIKAYVPNV